LKALLNYAIRRHKVITANPCSGLRDSWNELQPRTSYIAATKIGACWNLLTTLQGQAYGRAELSGIELIMFLLLTGCRVGEALELTWEHVNLEESWYHLPDPKNRRPIWLPLSSQAVEMLKARPRVRNNPHVFAGKNAGSSLTIAPRELWEKISVVAGLELTSHDARRTFTTLGVTECKLDLYKIDLLIGHKPNSVVMKHYMDTQHLQWLKPEVQTWADWIENKAVIAKAVAAGNVVELRTQKAG
jgi:site-specific recombinase XerD